MPLLTPVPSFKDSLDHSNPSQLVFCPLNGYLFFKCSCHIFCIDLEKSVKYAVGSVLPLTLSKLASFFKKDPKHARKPCSVLRTDVSYSTKHSPVELRSPYFRKLAVFEIDDQENFLLAALTTTFEAVAFQLDVPDSDLPLNPLLLSDVILGSSSLASVADMQTQPSSLPEFKFEIEIIDVLVTRYKGELLVFCLTERALFSISYDLKTVNSVLQLDETAVSLFKISDSEVAVCFR